jgi:hypothetical protein
VPPPGPVSPTAHEPPIAHVNAIVVVVVVVGASVVVVGATVVVVGATVVVVGATVVVVADFLVIIFVDVFAGYLADFAIFNVNVHDTPVPIVNFVGLLFGDKVHEPVFDHVLTPVEFVEATADRFFS